MNLKAVAISLGLAILGAYIYEMYVKPRLIEQKKEA